MMPDVSTSTVYCCGFEQSRSHVVRGPWGPGIWPLTSLLTPAGQVHPLRRTPAARSSVDSCCAAALDLLPGAEAAGSPAWDVPPTERSASGTWPRIASHSLRLSGARGPLTL